MISHMARPKTLSKKHPLTPRTHSLTKDTNTILQRLSQDASDALGWTVGGSAIVRSLLRYVGQQPTSWVSATLHPLIEQEIANGTFWGSKKK